MKKLITLFTFLILLGCSKDDNSSSEEEQLIDGGTAKTSQLVVINNDNVTEDIYQATLGGQSIIIAKTAENELVFKVPNQMEIGEQILTIPSLNNLKIKYQIIENVLSGSAEENLSTYFSNIQNHLSSIEESANYDYVNGYFQKFDEVFQNLSEEDKVIMAKFYKANQSRFDDLLTTDFSNRMMFDGSDFELLLRFSAATIGFGVSAAIAILDPEPVTKVIAMGVCIIAWNKAIDYKQKFADRNIKKLNVLIDGLESLLQGRNMMSVLELTTGVSSSFPLESNSRAIINSDSSDDNENVNDYFSKHNTYNSTIENVNVAIDFINDNFFLTDFDLIPLSTINTSNPVDTILENEEFYNRINFSIESDNVNIDNISFANGYINITVSIIDQNDVNEFIETGINFTYEDEFNRLTGSYPVKIYLENENSKWYEVVFSCDNDVTGSTCQAQLGKTYKYYINIINNNENFSGTIYFKEIDDITGVSNVNFSADFIIPSNNPNLLISTTMHENGTETSYTINNGNCTIYNTYSAINCVIKMSSLGENVQVGSNLYVNGNQFTECIEVCYGENIYNTKETYNNNYQYATFIGSIPPSDL